MLKKKQIFKKIEGQVNDNLGKYLSGDGGRRAQIYQRDRKPQTTYYLITIKGNYIRGYKINYVNSKSDSVNTYTELFIPTLLGRTVEVPVTKRVLIAKEKFRDYKLFIDKFKENSKSLGWRNENGEWDE